MQQILERTLKTGAPIPSTLAAHAASGPSDDRSGRNIADPAAIRRIDSAASSKLTKDKK
jgi:hypothetical protein